MAIFVHNNPSNPIATEERPQLDLSRALGMVRQARMDEQQRKLKERELNINEARYQDYIKFRNEELAAKKAVEDRLAGQEDTTYNRQAEQDILLGKQQHNTAVNLLNDINAEKRDTLGRLTVAANKIQELNALKAAGKPVDAHQMTEWERLAKQYTTQITQLDQSAHEIARQLRHGQILNVNRTTGEYRLSDPILPQLRGQSGSSTQSGGGPSSGAAAPSYFQEPPTSTGQSFTGMPEEPGAGTGEAFPLPKSIPTGSAQPIRNTGVIPSFYRENVAPEARALMTAAGRGVGNYASTAGRALVSDPYRYWISGQPFDVKVNQPDMVQMPSFWQEAPALTKRFFDFGGAGPAQARPTQADALRAIMEQYNPPTNEGYFPSYSDEQLRSILGPSYFQNY